MENIHEGLHIPRKVYNHPLRKSLSETHGNKTGNKLKVDQFFGRKQLSNLTAMEEGINGREILQNIIIPKGSIKQNETAIIEIPPQLRNSRTLVVTPKQSTKHYNSTSMPSANQKTGTIPKEERYATFIRHRPRSHSIGSSHLREPTPTKTVIRKKRISEDGVRKIVSEEIEEFDGPRSDTSLFVDAKDPVTLTPPMPIADDILHGMPKSPSVFTRSPSPRPSVRQAPPMQSPPSYIPKPLRDDPTFYRPTTRWPSPIRSRTYRSFTSTSPPLSTGLLSQDVSPTSSLHDVRRRLHPSSETLNLNQQTPNSRFFDTSPYRNKSESMYNHPEVKREDPKKAGQGHEARSSIHDEKSGKNKYYNKDGRPATIEEISSAYEHSDYTSVSDDESQAYETSYSKEKSKKTKYKAANENKEETENTYDSDPSSTEYSTDTESKKNTQKTNVHGDSEVNTKTSQAPKKASFMRRSGIGDIPSDERQKKAEDLMHELTSFRYGSSPQPKQVLIATPTPSDTGIPKESRDYQDYMSGGVGPYGQVFTVAPMNNTSSSTECTSPCARLYDTLSETFNNFNPQMHSSSYASERTGSANGTYVRGAPGAPQFSPGWSSVNSDWSSYGPGPGPADATFDIYRGATISTEHSDMDATYDLSSRGGGTFNMGSPGGGCGRGGCGGGGNATYVGGGGNATYGSGGLNATYGGGGGNATYGGGGGNATYVGGGGNATYASGGLNATYGGGGGNASYGGGGGGNATYGGAPCANYGSGGRLNATYAGGGGRNASYASGGGGNVTFGSPAARGTPLANSTMRSTVSSSYRSAGTPSYGSRHQDSTFVGGAGPGCAPCGRGVATPTSNYSNSFNPADAGSNYDYSMLVDSSIPDPDNPKSMTFNAPDMTPPHLQSWLLESTPEGARGASGQEDDELGLFGMMGGRGGGRGGGGGARRPGSAQGSGRSQRGGTTVINEVSSITERPDGGRDVYTESVTEYYDGSRGNASYGSGNASYGSSNNSSQFSAQAAGFIPNQTFPGAGPHRYPRAPSTPRPLSPKTSKCCCGNKGRQRGGAQPPIPGETTAPKNLNSKKANFEIENIDELEESKSNDTKNGTQANQSEGQEKESTPKEEICKNLGSSDGGDCLESFPSESSLIRIETKEREEMLENLNRWQEARRRTMKKSRANRN